MVNVMFGAVLFSENVFRMIEVGAWTLGKREIFELFYQRITKLRILWCKLWRDWHFERPDPDPQCPHPDQNRNSKHARRDFLIGSSRNEAGLDENKSSANKSCNKVPVKRCRQPRELHAPNLRFIKAFSIWQPQINHECPEFTKITENPLCVLRNWKASLRCSSLNLILLKVNHPFSFPSLALPPGTSTEGGDEKQKEQKIGKQFFPQLIVSTSKSQIFSRLLLTRQFAGWNEGSRRRRRNHRLVNRRKIEVTEGGCGKLINYHFAPERLIEISTRRRTAEAITNNKRRRNQSAN